jgi:site-specific DNA-methyltransferase (adenine-specific)
MTADMLLDVQLEPPPGGEILHASDRVMVIWGDCRDPQVIASVPNAYELLATDPPYGMAFNSGRSDNFHQIAGDDGSIDWPGVLAEWVGPEGTCTRGLKDKRHVYVFGYQPDQLATPLRLGGHTVLAWDKVSIGMGDLAMPWAPQHEPITFGVHVKRRAGRAAGDGRLAARLRQGSIIRYQRPNAGSAVRHSNEKPWPVMAQLIESSTVRGELVVDPCAGSGSTGVAAILTGRRCFLVEINRKDAELAVQRVQAAERLAQQMEAS